MKQNSLFRYIFAAITTMLTLASCDDDNPKPQPEPELPGRSVLVYMAANNNLSGYDNDDIREMRKAASEGSLGTNRLIIYHHSASMDPVLQEVTPDGLVDLKTYDKSESAVSASRMRQVIDDFQQEAPAKNHGLILWSHGSGWEQNGMEETAAKGPQRAFGIDRFNGRNYSMNITTLADVLDGRGFDYVYFDCCHMAGVEVAYQLRQTTSYIAGSVTELPSEGMPYHHTLPFLMKDEPDLIGGANATFSYFDKYSGSNRTCTMSVIDTSQLDRLAAAVADVYALHPTLPEQYSPQKFIRYNCYFFDLEHYLKALGESSEEVAARVNVALEALDDAVIYKAATPYIWEGAHDWYGRDLEVKLDSHCGLSTYILQASESAATFNYNTLDWYSDVASLLF